MSGKKNIFEKLGLVESVDESIEQNIDTITEEKQTETMQTKEKINEEKQIEVKQEEVKKEAVEVKTEIKEIKSPDLVKKVETKSLPKEEKQIGEKLDVLIESYERDKLLSVDDIYRKASLVKNTKDTIFMANVFLKALPENLPTDVKRESLWNIMKASEIRVEELLSDAYERIDALNNVLEKTVSVTDDLNKKHEKTMMELENRIKDLKKDIQDRLKFQESQNTSIEYEIQKIINLVEFIKAK